MEQAEEALLDALLIFLGDRVIDAYRQARELQITPTHGLFAQLADDVGADEGALRALLNPPPAPEDLRLAVAQLAGVLLRQWATQ